jgi:ATP synthase protein I
MLARYGPIAWRSAAVTAVAAVIMVAIATAIGGTKGLLGGVLAVAMVTAFFAISVVAVGSAARISPQAMMATALGTYAVKILALIIVVSRFTDTTAFNSRLFGVTAVVCILVWCGAQAIWSMRLKTLYVEPDGER